MVGKLAQRVVRQSAVDDVTLRRERTAFDHVVESGSRMCAQLGLARILRGSTQRHDSAQA